MKSKLLITFPNTTGDKPIVYNLIKNYDLKINIIKASFDFNFRGSLFVEVDGSSENIARGLEYVEQEGVLADFINSTITVDRAVCVECGLCTSACQSQALSLDQEQSLVFQNSKCIGCNLCIKVCPSRAISNGVVSHES
ncbi:MAG: 4Fe-4S binding protein [Clostridia bacterium]|nr:4Fe-4S binding protein [Clostridia bacterium]